jgi:serine protease
VGKDGAMKMKWLISILAIVAILFTFGVIPASANGGELKEFRQPEIVKAKWVPDEILVRFKGDTEHFRVIKVPEGKALEKVKEYSKRSDVDYAEPNYYAYAFWGPDDPYYRYQWDLDNPDNGGIQMGKAWDIQKGGSASVVVAVVDTGVAYENYNIGQKRYYLAPDLANTVFVPGYDFVENDTHPNDDNSHGTHVTGTIAQSTNNGVGVAGVAFNTAIMPVKVLGKNGSGTYTNVANGIYWATDHGANIINLSLGGSSPSQTLQDAVKYAYEHGVTVIAAAGNDGSSQVSYPAAYDNYVIAVGATRYDETLAYYSNYGASLDLVAPGGDMNVDQNNDGYGDGVLQNTFNPNTKNTGAFGYWFFQGTSMAAPHVSGVAALLSAHGNATTPDEIRTALQETAEDLGVSGRDNTYGWGLVDAYAALQWTAGPVDNPPTVSITSPAEGTTVAGTVTIEADASDDVGVTQVEFFADATSIAIDSNGSDGWSTTWNSSLVSDGNHSITAEATDTIGQKDSDSISVTVDNVNDSPVANAGPDQSAYVGDAVTFNGSGSSDPDGNIVSYDWNFGDGTSGSGLTASHAYSGAGTYTVTLTVTDNGELTDQDTAIVTISEAPAVPTAWVNIELSKQTIGSRWRVTATVTITETNASGSAIANARVYGTWSGAYSRTVSGTTDGGGKASFRSGFIRGSGTVTFTVNKIVKNGQEYVLSGETSESMSNGSQTRFQRE